MSANRSKLQSITSVTSTENNTPVRIRLHTGSNRGWCYAFEVTKVKEKTKEKQVEEEGGIISGYSFFSLSKNDRRWRRDIKPVRKVSFMTTFYKDLQTLQKRYYIHLRTRIVLYQMDITNIRFSLTVITMLIPLMGRLCRLCRSRWRQVYQTVHTRPWVT